MIDAPRSRHYKVIFIILIAAALNLVALITPALAEDTANPSTHQSHATDASHGAGHGGHDLGTHLPLWSCIPFAGMLLSIALWPLAAPEFWHHHFGKISAFWAMILAVPFVYTFRGTATYEILHIMLARSLPA